MKQRLLTVITLCMTTLVALAQGPNNTGKYYKRADGLTGAELKTAMFQIIRDPGIVRYDDLQAAYVTTDTRSDGCLRDFYSTITQYVPGSNMGKNTAEGATYNREHCVCQSWFGSKYPMYADIVHVIPTDGYINSRHNDNPFGEVTDNAANYNSSSGGYSKWGAPRAGLGCPELVTTVFEPNDEVKGDIARIYFYMATCYQHIATTFTAGKGQHVFNADGTEYEPLQPWVMEMMMRWSALDPVDDVERARNAGVYQIQRNRNPFVDYPGLETYIWGDKKDVAFSYDYYEGEQQGTDIGDDPDYSAMTAATTITLNNTFFGVDWTGSRPETKSISISGWKKNVKIIYFRGDSGSNMYCNASQIRLYQKNLLTLRMAGGLFSKLVFTLPTTTTKTLNASVGSVSDYTWTGNADEVVFNVDDGAGNVQLSSVTIYPVATGIWALPEPEISDEVEAIYDAQGRRIADMQPGLNLVRMKDGRVLKIMK